MNDPALQFVLAAKAGDERAWRDLLAMFEPAMRKYVNRSVYVGRDEDDAWSLCHEILIRCVRTFDPRRRIRFCTLLFHGLSNVPLGAMQRGPIHVPASAYRTNPEHDRRAKRVLSLDARNSKARRSLHERIGRDGEAYSDLREVVQSAVSQLQDRDRRIVRMRLSGFSHKEIAELEGCTPQRSFQIESRAHRTLRELLAEAPL